MRRRSRAGAPSGWRAHSSNSVRSFPHKPGTGWPVVRCKTRIAGTPEDGHQWSTGQVARNEESPGVDGQRRRPRELQGVWETSSVGTARN